MYLKISFFAFNILILIASIYAHDGYYWRPFFYEIPADAFAAGACKNESFYIGRAVTETGLYIGSIFNVKTQKLSVPFSNEGSKDLFEILCTDHRRPPRWISTDFSNLNNVPNKIYGGYFIENQKVIHSVYIGKKGYKVGQINPLTGMHFYDTNSNTTAMSKNYEVLVYDP